MVFAVCVFLVLAVCGFMIWFVLRNVPVEDAGECCRCHGLFVLSKLSKIKLTAYLDSRNLYVCKSCLNKNSTPKPNPHGLRRIK